jgi:hypothetical protein
MSESVKQLCIHYINGNCKYGLKCNKLHINPNLELLQEIEKKGPILCNFYPNCKFDDIDCKKLHIDIDNYYLKEILELKDIYSKIIFFKTEDPKQLHQIERIKYMIKGDLNILKDTWENFNL